MSKVTEAVDLVNKLNLLEHTIQEMDVERAQAKARLAELMADGDDVAFPAGKIPEGNHTATVAKVEKTKNGVKVTAQLHKPIKAPGADSAGGKIITYLKKHPTKTFHAADISKALKISSNYAVITLSKLLAAKQIKRPARGEYQTK